MENPLKGLIGSATRVKLLMRLFLNPHARSYLRELAREFSVSTNAVREELNQLSRTDLLKVEKEGRNVFYRANTDHALFPELRSMVQKVMGIDQVVDGIVQTAGEAGEGLPGRRLRRGQGHRDHRPGPRREHQSLPPERHQRKTEANIKRKIRSLVLTRKEFAAFRPTLEKSPTCLVFDRQKDAS